MQAQISLCAMIGYMYYCEYAHLLKKCIEQTCMSAIYYDQSSEIKANKCKMIVTFDTLLESKIPVLVIFQYCLICKSLGKLFAKMLTEPLILNIQHTVYLTGQSYVNAP